VRARLTRAGTGVTLAQIADGSEDAYLIRQALAVRAYHGTVYIRLDQEMNGSWFKEWSGDPAGFVAAWRHVVDVFRSAGAHNARWVWGPDLLVGFSEAQKEADTAPYWPGAAYVNVIGATLVQFAFTPQCEIACRIITVDWLHSTFKKPVWFAEAKVDAAERYAWLRSLGAAMRTRPWIRALVWTEYPSLGQVNNAQPSGNMDWQLPTDRRARRLLLAL